MTRGPDITLGVTLPPDWQKPKGRAIWPKDVKVTQCPAPEFMGYGAQCCVSAKTKVVGGWQTAGIGHYLDLAPPPLRTPAPPPKPAAKPAEPTPADFDLLEVIAALGGTATNAEIAKATGQPRTNVKRAVYRAWERGVIERSGELRGNRAMVWRLT